MKKLLLFKKLIFGILLAGLSSTGWAQILDEPFDYPTPAYIGGNTDVLGVTSNNWATHNITATQTTTIDIQDESLSYPGLKGSTGNKVYLFSNRNATSRDVNRAFTTTAKVLYFSALVNIIDTMQLKTAGDYFMHFGGTSGSAVSSPNVGGRLGVKLTTTPTATTFRFMIKNNSGTGEAWTDNGSDLNIGTTYLVVVKLDLNAAISVATMWVNPAFGATEPAGGISNNSGINTFSAFKSICLRNSIATPKAYIDEIRVGETYADVTPISGVGLINTENATRQSSIFPNPPTSYFNVKAPEGKYLVSVHNSIGTLIKTEYLNSAGKVEIPNLNPGLYFVTVENLNTKQKEVHKLMVR